MRKHILFVIITVGLLLAAGCTGKPASETVTLSGAFALYPLAVRWQEEYAKLKPDIKVEVAAGGAGKGMTDVLGGLVDIAMVSRDVSQPEKDKGALPLAVAKDAVIPTLNARNQSLSILTTRGLSRDELDAVWIKKSATRWNDFKGLADKGAIRVYTRSDACGAGEVWAKYLGGKSQDDLAGVRVFGDPGLAEAVVKDIGGVGYNNINFAYDAKTLRPVEGLAILKIDFNNNGRIDPEEDVYATRTDLMNAIRIGRFPSPPARNLFFVVKGRPAKAAVADFLAWTLTEGQRYVEESGYINVKDEDLKNGLERLH